MNLITPKAILSYPSLFTADSIGDEDEPKYRASFVFEEGTDISELKRTAIEAAQDRWGEELADMEIVTVQTPHGPHLFLKGADGLTVRLPWNDIPERIEDKGYPEGSTYINAKSDNPPGVVSRIKDPSNDGKPAVIVNPSGDVRFSDGTVHPGQRPVYAGAIVRGLLSVYAWDSHGNQGVSFGLSGVQVVDDGERLDGRADPQDEFDADMDASADLSDLGADAEEGDSQPSDAAADNGAESAEGDDDDLSDLIGS